ncbi:hypothetical protein VOLCADRAFT_88911 [Volvox carteri f. nagariensis]|uniref:Ion transport domain-containing protein n=1 Tax=Volvox carteri f. nagariensis TaxID=3068 RepID=D8TQA3_VOLCA|nr:uncharacterized protein VOLCADRAFT_88911 [Volvox carteri f. nagariensis]EFJ50499.1 hypothetical protein VOLCADRAFT_88911 [Volvox carteri f. nagariensis]|eukprot:XP_002948624.1 hypothetical protein VOLCADRAFT_88911 [Volvox carteri f. nagariensis]
MPRILHWLYRQWLLFYKNESCKNKSPATPRPSRWTICLLALALYNAVSVPLYIAFESWRKQRPTICLGWAVSMTFCLDIVVNFRTSYMTSRGDIIRTPYLIAQQYLRGMFLLDLISALPLDEIVDIIVHGDGHKNLYWLGVLRLPRLAILLGQVNTIIPVKYYNFVSVAKLLMVMLLLTHWAACVWYYLSQEIQAGNLPWIFTVDCRCDRDRDKYLYAFFRSFLVMLGDRPPAHNNVERMFVLVLLFLGACFYAIVMGSMTLLVSSMWSMASRHKHRAMMLQDALRYNGAAANNDMRSRVDVYFNFMAEHDHPGMNLHTDRSARSVDQQ